MQVRWKLTLLVAGVCLVGSSTGCSKKVAVAPPPPPPAVQETPAPPPQVPTASITAEPGLVEVGQAVTLKWSTTNATSVTISLLGEVEAEGRQEVRPGKATTYELVAKGPGGSATASATVNVMAPPPPIVPPPPIPPKSLQERIASEISDVYFDYDRSEIREDARAALTLNAEALRAILADFPTATVILEGHCDERGSAEYNLGLGDRRADSAHAFLEALGLSAARLKTVSYGKERPQCTEETETCWQANRRVHFSAGESPVTTN